MKGWLTGKKPKVPDEVDKTEKPQTQAKGYTGMLSSVKALSAFG